MGGAEPSLYGLDDAEGQAEIIFVEGEIDKLSLEVAGLCNAVRAWHACEWSTPSHTKPCGRLLTAWCKIAPAERPGPPVRHGLGFRA